MNKRYIFCAFVMSMLMLVSCTAKEKAAEKAEEVTENTEKAAPVEEKAAASYPREHSVPELEGRILDVLLQSELMNSGFLLSVTEDTDADVPKGQIISQIPAGGTSTAVRGETLILTVGAGKNGGEVLTSENDEQLSEDGKNGQRALQTDGDGEKAVNWILSPTIEYDDIITFGKTGYSICHIGGTYGIIDMNGNGVGMSDYTKLFYCPEHGISCPDVKEPTAIAEDLTLAPDCGYDPGTVASSVFVYDEIRSRVYAVGISDGKFRIAEISGTDYFGTNDHYIALLYSCDTELEVYMDAGFTSLAEIYKAEDDEMRYGVINRNMEHIVGFIYDSIRDGNGCYIVEEDGKYGYRGLMGEFYYPCIFEKANPAYLGDAWVRYEGKWGTVAME